MTCLFFVGGQKSFVLCHNLTEVILLLEKLDNMCNQPHSCKSVRVQVILSGDQTSIQNPSSDDVTSCYVSSNFFLIFFF
jgi:hypothetical protein